MTAVTKTEAARGLKRIGHHVWRVARHLKRGYAGMPISTYSTDDTNQQPASDKPEDALDSR